MVHKGGLEALNRSLRDICNCEKPFGGLIPADPASCQNWHSSRRTQGMRPKVKACKSSYLWHKVTTMTLRRNMRVNITGNPEGGRWAAKLLQLGRGNIPTNADDEIDLTTLGVNIVNSAQELQSKIYPYLEENYFTRRVTGCWIGPFWRHAMTSSSKSMPASWQRCQEKVWRTDHMTRPQR